MLLPRPATESGAAIELTPLIDMVFLLLIFFLVATTFQQTEREMQIALPTAQSSAPISALVRDLVVNVAADGRVLVQGREVTVENLGQMVRDAASLNAEQKVTVRGDRRTPYANIVTVLDVCKTAGIQEPYLDTVTTE